MKAEQYFDKIDLYLNGGLNAEEHTAFETQINADAELQQAVDSYLLSVDAVDVLIEDSLRMELKKLQAEESEEEGAKIRTLSPQRGRVRRLVRTISIAASVLLVIGFFSLQYVGSQYSNQGIHKDLYDEQAWSKFRGDDNNNTTGLFVDGLAALDAKDYPTAITAFEQVPTESDRYIEAQYYLGHANLLTKDYSKAVTAFTKVAQSDDFRYQEKGQWNLVLALLANDQLNDTFYGYLNEISQDNGHSYHQDAVKLNEKLNSAWRRIGK